MFEPSTEAVEAGVAALSAMDWGATNEEIVRTVLAAAGPHLVPVVERPDWVPSANTPRSDFIADLVLGATDDDYRVVPRQSKPAAA